MVDQDKYLSAGEKWAGIFEGWQHMAEVHEFDYSYLCLMRNSMYTLQTDRQTYRNHMEAMSYVQCFM